MKELIHGRGVAVEEKQKGRGRAQREGRRAHGVIRVGCGPGMTDERLGYDGARAGKSLANKEVGSGPLWSRPLVLFHKPVTSSSWKTK